MFVVIFVYWIPAWNPRGLRPVATENINRVCCQGFRLLELAVVTCGLVGFRETEVHEAKILIFNGSGTGTENNDCRGPGLREA